MAVAGADGRDGRRGHAGYGHVYSIVVISAVTSELRDDNGCAGDYSDYRSKGETGVPQARG